MIKRALTLLVILSFNLPVFAHGNMEHVLGTVVQVSDHSLSVKVSDGTIKVVLLNDESRFLQGSTPATLKDIKVGMRVVIHAHKHGDSLVAAEVKIGSPNGTNHPVSHSKEMI